MLVDRETGERVAVLFGFRGRAIPKEYVNDNLIPLLCRKAGVPMNDARGRITSHRACATTATQLYNAKGPMTLFELQAWLGHRSPAATHHYARIAPTTLAKAYADAGYFARNVRSIEVLVDREATLVRQAGFVRLDARPGYSAALSNVKTAAAIMQSGLTKPSFRAAALEYGVSTERYDRMTDEISRCAESWDSIAAFAECHAIAWKP